MAAGDEAGAADAVVAAVGVLVIPYKVRRLIGLRAHRQKKQPQSNRSRRLLLLPERIHPPSAG